MRTILTILLFVPVLIFAQTDNKLSFDFGIGTNTYKMDSLNIFYIDSFMQIDSLMSKNIECGNSAFVSFKYQPNMLFYFGIYANYQYGISTSKPKVYIYTGEWPILQYYGDYKLKTEAIGVGLSNSLYISHILNFENKKSKFLQNSRIATEINAGIGYSCITMDYRYPTLTNFSTYNFFTSTTDFQGQISIKYEYNYLSNPLLSTIGIKVGYQYFVTKILKDNFEQDWNVLNIHPINLDFSGIFYSMYISFGK